MTQSNAPIELRRARLDDVWRIREIDDQVYPTPWSEKLLRREISSKGRLHLVAEADIGVLGHGGIVLLEDQAHVTTVAVDPSRQGLGLGRAIMLGLFRGALALGCGALTLEVRAGNAAALALYRRFGLAPAGVRRGYYSDTDEDALVLWSPELVGQYLGRIANMSYPIGTTLSSELQTWEPTEASCGAAQRSRA